MKKIKQLNIKDLEIEKTKLQERLLKFKSKNLKLNMSRGKPCSEQLDLSMGLFDLNNTVDNYKAVDGTDCRNYGGIEGLPEARELFANMLNVNTNEIIIGGNSSLNLMYDTIARAIVHGVRGSTIPWGKLPKIKFLCPSPGYDRHFGICEHFNIEMITVDMKDDGPDMDTIENLVSKDEYIKGIWCTPKYSNPQGITYSDEVVERFASLKPKAKDFRIFWDNAYSVHHLSDKHDELNNILDACKKSGNDDMVFIFSSTSKITFPGAGLSILAASNNNIHHIKSSLFYQTIGPDKINQLRHVKFLENVKNIEEHMKLHAQILKPKFDTVLGILEKELGGKEIAWWNNPNGGYFISLDTLEGCAKSVVAMAAEAGVLLTKAGATYPYGNDPFDRNIRIAPTFPPLDELKTAIQILCICIQLVSIEKTLNTKLN